MITEELLKDPTLTIEIVIITLEVAGSQVPEPLLKDLILRIKIATISMEVIGEHQITELPPKDLTLTAEIAAIMLEVIGSQVIGLRLIIKTVTIGGNIVSLKYIININS